MVKHKYTPPSFLQKTLSDGTYDFVKKHAGPFLDKAKKDNGGTWPDTMDMFCDFVDHLGQKDKSFRNVPHRALLTTYRGVNQIYHLIRKKVEKPEQEPIATTPAKPTTRATPDKGTARDAAKAVHIVNDDAVQVTEAEPKSHGDEKNVKYYRRVNSSVTLSAPSSVSASSKRISKPSRSGRSAAGHAKFQHAKQLFGGLLDAYEQGELTFVRFEYDFITGQCTATATSKKDDAQA